MHPDRPISAIIDDNDQQIEITDVNSVKALSFRQLQKACVARGLPAVVCFSRKKDFL